MLVIGLSPVLKDSLRTRDKSLPGPGLGLEA